MNKCWGANIQWRRCLPSSWNAMESKSMYVGSRFTSFHLKRDCNFPLGLKTWQIQSYFKNPSLRRDLKAFWHQFPSLKCEGSLLQQGNRTLYLHVFRNEFHVNNETNNKWINHNSFITWIIFNLYLVKSHLL